MNKVRWLALLFFSTAVMADEGMWLPQQLPELEDELKARGLRIEVQNIAKLTEFPLNTVVSLGGCSGSFVSAAGLVVTNYHCAYNSIQHHSSNTTNLLQDGFFAATLQQELPAAPGSKILLTQQVENVTRQIRQELTPQLSGLDRFDKIEQVRKELVSACETSAGIRCSLYSYDGGLAYYLLKQFELTDVRLVYAPAAGVGQFGGDIDNWMWPRHTGDFAFYRAYVGKDGQPAPYHSDNIPFTPPAFLKVSAKGVQAQDFVMVLGYPARTYRHLTAAELKLQFTQILPLQQQYRADIIRLIQQHSAENSAELLSYQSRLAGLQNRSKNTHILLETYQSSALQQRKEQQQQALLHWIKAEPGRQARFLPALLDLEMLVQQQSSNLQRNTLLQAFDSVQLFSAARQLYRNAQEQLKPDSEREVGFQQRDQASLSATLKGLHNTMSPQLEIEIAWYLLQQYHQLPAVERVPLLDNFFHLAAGTALDQPALQQLKLQLQQMYQQTTLTDAATLLGWQQQPAHAFSQSQDPLLQLAVALYPAELAREQQQKTNEGKLLQLKPLVMAALQAFKASQQQKTYPDANGSLRVSFGTVQGYQPRDGVYYTPFTTVQGIAAKATGTAPFAAPAVQLNAIATANVSDYAATTLGSVPVNFLSTADTTVRNSGAATLNGQAELVGLLFGGVSESIVGDYDYDYDPATNRAVHLDSRYMLWQMDKVDGASRLLQEMVIVR
jgi:hypothetical protein